MQHPTITMNCMALCTAVLLGSTSLLAQSETTPTTTAEAKDVIKLSEFDVVSSSVAGYRTSNSITATGIGAPIIYAPVPINVLTGDLLKDLNYMQMNQVLAYVPGFQTSSYESTIQIRGFLTLQIYRNGFYRRATFPTWNLDRIEVIKGADSVFYGVVRPGGIVNYITSKPSFTGSFEDLTISMGSDSYLKEELYANVKASDSLALRVGLGNIDGGSWRNGNGNKSFNRQSYEGLSGTWRIGAKQDLTLELEHIYWKFTDPRGIDLMVTNSKYYGNPQAIASGQDVTTWVRANLGPNAPIYDAYPNPDPKGPSYNTGRGTWVHQESDTADLTYHFKLSDALVFEAAFNEARDFFEEIRSINSDNIPYADGTIKYQFGHFGTQRNSVSLNNKLVWRFDLCGTKNTLQVGDDYFNLKFKTPGLLTSSNTFQNGIRSAFFKETTAQAAQRDAIAAIAATGQVFSFNRFMIDHYNGGFAMNQTELFDDRLNLLYGVRSTKASEHTSYSYGPVVGAPKPSECKGTTPEYAALYKVKKDVSAFVTYSKTIEPSFSVDYDGKPLDAVEDTGYDIGVKTALLDSRVSITISYYDEKRSHLATPDTAKQLATGNSPYYFYGAAAESRGVEADLNITPVNNWSLIVGYSHDLEDKYTASPDPTVLNQPLGGVPKDFVTVWNRYDIKNGTLKGFYVAGGCRYSSSARNGNDLVGANSNNVLMVPSYVVWDATVGYIFKTKTQSITATLDVRNVFNRLYREGIDAAWAPPRLVFFSLRYKF